MCVEHVKKYNKRITKAIDSFTQKGNSAAIIGRGRTTGEQSLILVERGSYFGFGYFNKEVSITDFESAKSFVSSSVETPTVQNLVNSYLTNPRGTNVVVF